MRNNETNRPKEVACYLLFCFTSRLRIITQACVHVFYLGLRRNVIGCPEEEVELSPGATVSEIVGRLAKRHGDTFR